MKKIGILSLCILFFTLTACSSASDDDEPFSAAFVITEPAEPTEVFFDSSAVPPQISGHADSFQFDITEHLMIASAFGTGDVLARWNGPIRYALCGRFTADDAQVAADFARQLSSVSGFPDIRETTETEANVRITVTDVAAADVSITASSAGEIRQAEILLPSDARFDRDHAMRISLFRICGLLYQTETTLDTVNAETYPASAPTDTDWLLLEILYGDMQSGMTRDECRTAFKEHFKAQ